MTESLTQNAVSTLIDSPLENGVSPTFYPTVQVLKVIPVTKGNTSPGRFRVIISDGKHHCQGMLTTQNNQLVANGQLQDQAVLKIEEWMRNELGKVSVIILLKFTIISNPKANIGAPINYATASNAKTQQLPQAVQPKTETGNRGVGVGSYNSNNGNNNNNNNNMKSNYSNSNNPYASNNTRTPSSNNTSMSNPIMRTNPSTKPITPISSLNMYQSRWTIKARVTNKSDIRHWSNAKGDGQLFSIELLDSSGTDIRATFFKEAVDKFHPMLEMDKVYTLSGGRLKGANVQYNTCKSDYEVTFDQNAEIMLEADTGEIGEQNYELKPICELESIEPNSYVDVIGIIKNVAEPATIVSKKTGKELQKCELTVGDDSGAEVNCTIWGERAMNAPQEFANFPVVAFRRARVSDFGGRTLSASGGNGININPRLPDADRIRKWWSEGGSQNTGTVKKLTSMGGANRFPEFDTRKTIAAIRNEGLGQSSEKPDYVSFKGTFSFIKSDRDGGAWYPACPNPGEPCKNRCKVEEGTGGVFHCERCHQTFDNCIYRYIFSATVSDGSSTTWVSVFDDQARVMLNGMTADDLNNIYKDHEKGGQEAYEAEFAKACFTDWVLTCKVKQEMHQEQVRTKTSIQSIHPMDYVKEGRSLLNSILSM